MINRLLKTLLTFAATLSAYEAAAQETNVYEISHHYYYVNGVASNDVLNIRAEPTASAEIVGFLNFDENMVEVVGRSENGNWGLVNISEGTGWTSMRYLKEQFPQSFGSSKVPTNLACFGDYPNWTLKADRFSLQFNILGQSITEYPVDELREFRNPNTIVLSSGDDPSTAFDFRNNGGICFNEAGNAYPWIVEIYFPEETLSGCCTIQN